MTAAEHRLSPQAPSSFLVERRSATWQLQAIRSAQTKAVRHLSQATELTLFAVRNGLLDLSAAKPVSLTEKEEIANALRAGNFYVVRGNGNLSRVARGALPPETVPPKLIFPDLLIEIVPNPALLLPAFL